MYLGHTQSKLQQPQSNPTAKSYKRLASFIAISSSCATALIFSLGAQAIIISPESADHATQHPATAQSTPATPRQVGSQNHPLTNWNPQPVRQPWYAGGSLGVAQSADSNIGLGAGLFSGYRLNSNVAAEFNFLRLPFPGKKHNYLFATNANISLPLNNSLRAFGKVGLGIMKSPDKSRFGLLLGGGINYFAQPSLAFSTQLLGTVGATEAQSFAILGGGSYYFG